MQGSVITGGAGEADGQVEAVTIVLEGRAGAPHSATAPSAAALDAMFRQVRAEQSELQVNKDKSKPASSLQTLTAEIEDEPAARDSAASGGGRGRVDRGGAGAAPGSAQAANDKHGNPNSTQKAAGPGTAGSSGGLWGQIEPCWDNMPNVSTVPVTLVIVLNDQGRIATPPKIIRPSSAKPDEGRLISEARALAALAACVPYHRTDLLSEQRFFKVRFASQQ